ncbi:MAG: hypothetical protein D6738_03680 [Acidobacteria bacterium]|nr:MAG: hypothetical protein D6738_03680 [Acidobacteriota bacterium]
MPEVLSPRQLAEAIGVSESSVKRWVDVGRIEAATTAGGHRRIPLAAALRFVRRAGLPLAAPEALGLAAPSGWDEADDAGWTLRFSRALREGRAHEVLSLVRLAFATGRTSGWIVDEGLAPALDELGTLWRTHGDEGVFLEHRATQLGILVLEELRVLHGVPADDALPALGAAPAGDPYLLPTMAAGVVLEECGFAATNLGPDTPDSVIVAAIEQTRPALVWLSLTVARPNREQQRTVDRVARAASRIHAALALGGQASRTVRGAVSVDCRGSSMTELEAFARGLARGGAARRRPVSAGGA